MKLVVMSEATAAMREAAVRETAMAVSAVAPSAATTPITAPAETDIWAAIAVVGRIAAIVRIVRVVAAVITRHVITAVIPRHADADADGHTRISRSRGRD